MENVPTVLTHVNNLNTQVSGLQKVLDPIIHGVVPDTLSPLEQAQHYALLAYALDSIVFAHLKSNGVEHKNHPIMIELERIKAIMAKIKRVQDGEAPSERPDHLKIDKEAAARFIKHAIGSQVNTKKKFDSDGYLEKMAKDSEEKLKAKANPIEVSDDEESAKTKAQEPPLEDGDKKRKKKKKSLTLKKQKK